MREILTALYYEEREALQVVLETMGAIKMLKEAGFDISKLSPVDFVTPWDLDISLGLLTQLGGGTYGNFKEEPEEDEDGNPEYDENEEFCVVFLPLKEGYDADQIEEVASTTIGESLFSLVFENNGMKLVFYPGELPAPRPLATAEFMVKLKEICQKEGMDNENRPDNQ